MPRLLSALGLVLFAVQPTVAGWRSVAAMPPPEKTSGALVFRGASGTVAISVVAPEIVRVRFAPGGALGRDHSYAVESRDPGVAGAASLGVGTDRSAIDTGALRVRVAHDPFRIAFATATGEDLDADDEVRGMASAGAAVRVWKRLRDDEHVYGFGEKAGRLDKRGPQLGGSSLAMWNTDAYGYGDGSDPLYASVPFFMVLRNGVAHGIFLDNTFRTSFDVGHESEGLLSFGAEGGELNYYFIYGPSPKQVIERYTALTGRMPLPPRWALGYHQCRYSYYPESRVRSIARSFRERRIPADTLWLDIHYLEGYKPFTWDQERFPDPAKLLAELRAQGFRVVTIIDPHPKKQAGYAPYDGGVAGDHFVKNPDGSLYEGRAWPALAPRDPGASVFPDFSRPATREWWGSLHRGLLDLGVAGIWNDMNEPAVFLEPHHTMPLDLRHDNEGSPTDHREIHNVYGMLMTRSTHEGLLRLRPEARPFVLTRASFAGGQRWAALWPGDNSADWSQLRASIPMLLGLGLSGFPFVGADIGGFAGAPSPELFTRWLQLGAFYPFMRAHTEIGTPDQEPWSYGAKHEAVNRRAIELRYELLPHLYSVMAEAAATGVPALRPLFMEFPEDTETYAVDDQFLLGRDLLVAPVVREGATERELYLPAGDWYELGSGKRHEGGHRVKLPVTLDSIPVFVRAGGFVFRQPVVQHTGEMAGQPLIVELEPAERSEASLYEDEGEGFAYRSGTLLRRRFSQGQEQAGRVIEVGDGSGSWRPAPRDLVFRVATETEPRRVTLDGIPLKRSAVAPADGSPSWSRGADGLLTVRLRDPAAPLRIFVER